MSCVVISVFVLAASVSAQEQRYRFETRVEAVAVDVAVTRDERPVTGLTIDDFELKDNGVLQAIDRVQVEKVPVDAVLLLDNSESVAGPKLAELRGAVRSFVSGLRNDDRVALVTFSHQIQLRQDLTADSAPILIALSKLTAWGHTALYDALFGGLMLVEPPVTRPVVVLFSDGLDNMSRISEPEILEAVRQSNAVVYTVRSSPSTEEVWASAPSGESRLSGYGSTRSNSGRVNRGRKIGPFQGVGTTFGYQSRGVSRQRTTEHNKFLRLVADESGGRLIEFENIADMELEFRNVLEEIKTRYLLTYYPTGVDEPGWHQLEVKLKNRKGDVRARRGYSVRLPVQ